MAAEFVKHRKEKEDLNHFSSLLSLTSNHTLRKKIMLLCIKHTSNIYTKQYRQKRKNKMTRQITQNIETGIIGPYSNAINSGELIFLSGQTGIDQQTGQLIQGDITLQTRQSLTNLFTVLKNAGLTETDVQKVNVYLTDMNDFAAMNDEYQKHFSKPYPARTTIGVAALPLGAKVEIEMIARSK